MYKNIIILLLAGLLGYFYFVQQNEIKPNVPEIVTVDSLKNIKTDSFHACFFDGIPKTISSINFDLSKTEQDLNTLNYLDSIMKLISLPKNFTIGSAKSIDNACAYIGGIAFDKRYIIYNTAYFEKVINTTETRFSVMSILAHEIGHHLSGHTLNPRKSNSNSELEADKFSGYILGCLGADSAATTITLDKFVSEEESETHPSKSNRKVAIMEGWKYATSKNKIKTKERISYIPDTAVTIITDEEIYAFLRKWRLYQNNKKFNQQAFENYSALYSGEFLGIRRALDSIVKARNKTMWLDDRLQTYKFAKNVIVNYNNVEIIDKDNNGYTIQFIQNWSTDRYEESGTKLMKLYKNRNDQKIYIVYEELIKPEYLYKALNYLLSIK
jgi:hypothetical protein